MSLEKKNAVVILGAGIMQVPAIETAIEEGYYPVVFDGHPSPVGKEIAELFYHIDIKDYNKIYKKCLDLEYRYKILGVFTAGTDFSFIVAKLSEMMNLPGISYETSLRATVKSDMRKAFKNSNVNSPGFVTADSCFNSENRELSLNYPLVVKPVDSMGGRGSVKVDSVAKLDKAVRDAVVFSRSGNAIIEEFIEGAEFSLDAVIDNDEITVCGIADRHIYFPPFFVEMGHTLPSIYPSDVQEKVINVFKEGIRAIGINSGAAKGDIKYDGEKAVVGEIAARLSGGYMSGWTFPYSSGVSVIRAALNIAVGKPSGLNNYKYQNTAAERAFISIPGIVENIIFPSYLEKENYPKEIKDLFLNVKEGEKVVFPRNNVQKCGNIIAVHEDREKAVFAAEQGCRDIIIRLESCNIDTEDFLLSEKEKWIPDAFKIENTDNLKILESMPFLNSLNNSSEFNKIAVMPLPFQEYSKDWLGRTFVESLNKVLEISGAEIAKPGKIYDAVIAKLFWNAFIRGGVQGGLWILDTIDKYLKEGDLPSRFIK